MYNLLDLFDVEDGECLRQMRNLSISVTKCPISFTVMSSQQCIDKRQTKELGTWKLSNLGIDCADFKTLDGK
jgi:hypothetical protein